MGLTLVHIDSGERFYDCIKKKELKNYKLGNYESPTTMRVKKESDPEDVERSMYKYKHKKYKNEDLHVLIPREKPPKPADSFGRGATERTSTRTTKISTTRRTFNPPVNIVLFGKQTITYNEGGEPAAKHESVSHRKEHEGEHHRRHRHHRRRGSGEPKDNRHASPNRRREGHGRETRRDRSPDTIRGKESDDGRSERGKEPELDLREKTHVRKMHNAEEDSDSEYSEAEIPRPLEKTPSGRSSLKVRRSTHSSRQGAALEDLPEIDAISLTRSQKAPSQKAVARRALSERSSLTGHSSKQSSRSGAALEDLLEADAISLVPSREAYADGRRSSRAPSTAGQSRISQNNEPLIPSSQKLTEENMSLLDGKASEPRSQGDYEASRVRRRSERASSGLSRKIES
ncbi:uncharacterized protein EAE97_008898 [Botrytis byssoidea]|uniref:Uncharacterized protein n=1 Tax=Botrytis byssoidea TaxID=139641 RepID=A0A9P5IG20_9HELO|nr:uncharacterized protein EAE97_008898 [Botrytis byssoidea]KAF7933131.1 hypothetical protein EAE97_008898 [Botrytis byssoidea]